MVFVGVLFCYFVFTFVDYDYIYLYTLNMFSRYSMVGVSVATHKVQSRWSRIPNDSMVFRHNSKWTKPCRCEAAFQPGRDDEGCDVCFPWKFMQLEAFHPTIGHKSILEAPKTGSEWSKCSTSRVQEKSLNGRITAAEAKCRKETR